MQPEHTRLMWSLRSRWNIYARNVKICRGREAGGRGRMEQREAYKTCLWELHRRKKAAPGVGSLWKSRSKIKCKWIFIFWVKFDSVEFLCCQGQNFPWKVLREFDSVVTLAPGSQIELLFPMLRFDSAGNILLKSQKVIPYPRSSSSFSTILPSR